MAIPAWESQELHPQQQQEQQEQQKQMMTSYPHIPPLSEQEQGSSKSTGDDGKEGQGQKEGGKQGEEGASRDDPIGIDIEGVRQCFQMLLDLGEEGVTNSLAHALESLVSKLWSLRTNRKAQPYQLRSFLVVLENPQLSFPEYGATLATAFSSLAALPLKLKRAMVHWLAHSAGHDRFRSWLGGIQQFITIKIYMNQTQSLLSAVKVLDLLHRANASCGSPAPIVAADFYNEAVNSEIFKTNQEMWRNYDRWRNDILLKEGERGGASGWGDYTSLVTYSFVLDPASKASILELDARVQMRKELEEEIRDELMRAQAHQEEPTIQPYLLLRVRRDSIVSDTVHNLMIRPDGDLKKQLKVQFVGEEGVDEGGVQKEYFQVLLKALLDPQYAMFSANSDAEGNDTTMWFNSDSLEAGEEFELIGMLLGIAIYNAIILDVRFPMVVYRRLKGLKPSLLDLKEAMPALGKGLQDLLDFEGDVEGVFCRTFQISREVFGEVRTFDLVEDGGQVPVTKENRADYVRRYVKYTLEDAIQLQFAAFNKGFHKVCGGAALDLFSPEELELLICGNPELDFDALERVTRYEDGFTADSPVVVNFWAVVQAFSEADKRKLLKFATGSDRAPINGLDSLVLVISKNGPDSDWLPTAHTCFNHLLLPDYSSREKLENRLRLAIEQAEGFGLQ